MRGFAICRVRVIVNLASFPENGVLLFVTFQRVKSIFEEYIGLTRWPEDQMDTNQMNQMTRWRSFYDQTNQTMNVFFDQMIRLFHDILCCLISGMNDSRLSNFDPPRSSSPDISCYSSNCLLPKWTQRNFRGSPVWNWKSIGWPTRIKFLACISTSDNSYTDSYIIRNVK